MKKKPITASEMGKTAHQNLKKKLGIKGYREEQKRRSRLYNKPKNNDNLPELTS